MPTKQGGRTRSRCHLPGLAIAFHVCGCGGLTQSERESPDASVDTGVQPSADASSEPDAELHDACPTASSEPDPCDARPVTKCPHLDAAASMPGIGGALKSIVQDCRACVGSWTCGSVAVELNPKGCAMSALFSHPGNKTFMACIQAKLDSVRFDCPEDVADASSFGVGIDSCTK